MAAIVPRIGACLQPLTNWNYLREYCVDLAQMPTDGTIARSRGGRARMAQNLLSERTSLQRHPPLLDDAESCQRDVGYLSRLRLRLRHLLYANQVFFILRRPVERACDGVCGITHVDK